MSTSSYTVRVGHSIQHLTLSEVEMGGGAITGSELLNRLAPSPPFIVPGVSAALWTTTGERKSEVLTSQDFSNNMELICVFDSKALMRGIVENMGNIVLVQQSLWVLAVSSWTAKDRLKATNLSIIEAVARLLSKYPDDEIVSQNALGAMRNITLDSPENVSRLGASGCASVFKAVKTFASNERLVENGLSVLTQLSENKAIIKDENSAEWADELQKMSRTYANNTEIIAAVCAIFGNIIPHFSTEIPEEFLLSVSRSAIAAIQTFRSDAAVVKGACLALGSMSMIPAVQGVVSEAGGYSLILGILRDCEALPEGDSSSSLSAAALKTLANLMSTGQDLEDNARRAAMEGAMDLVLQRLNLSMQSAAVAEHGFQCLKCLLLDAGNQAAAGSDALELITSGLDVHRLHKEIVTCACETLELLLETEANQELVFYSDIMDALVAAMQGCLDPGSTSTSPVGSRSSSSSSIRLGMLNLPPPPVIMSDSLLSEPAKIMPPAAPESLKPLPHSPAFGVNEVTKTLVACCCALTSAMGTTNFERARAAGAGEVVCNIIKKYALNADVVEHCSWTLSRLAFTTLGQIQLGNLGAVKIMFSALEMYKQDQGVVECIVYAISNLTFDPNNALIAISFGAFQVLTDVIAQYPSSEVIAERACVSLSNILTVQEDLSVIVSCNTIPVLVQVMTDFIDSPDVIEQALWAMGNMIGDDVQNKELAIQSGIKSNIRTIGKKYAENEDIMVQLRRVKHPVNKVWWIPDFNWLLS